MPSATCHSAKLVLIPDLLQAELAIENEIRGLHSSIRTEQARSGCRAFWLGVPFRYTKGELQSQQHSRYFKSHGQCLRAVYSAPSNVSG